MGESGASPLPPHKPYDCSTNLLRGLIPPSGRTFSLIKKEILEKYIADSLTTGLIQLEQGYF